MPFRHYATGGTEVLFIRRYAYPRRSDARRRDNTSAPNTHKPRGSTSAKSPDWPGTLQDTLNFIKIRLGDSMDLIVRQFSLADTKAALVCLEGMVSKKEIDQHILQPLLNGAEKIRQYNLKHPKKNLFTFLQNNIVTALECQPVTCLEIVVTKILSGNTALLIDKQSAALVMDTIHFKIRGVQEPETESVVRGPREGFTEALEVNTSLIRRKIKSPQLRLDKITLGRVTKTNVCMAYLKDIANPAIVAETKKRLARIEYDGILESGYIEAFINDAPYSIFATMGNTEKPDIAAAKMLEGRVIILVDGTPMALILPYLFIETLQASEDYYSSWYSGTLTRWIRIVSLLITVFLPALYVATTAYNPEALPTILMITLVASREGIPMPTTAEMIFLGVVFEILKEAGVRQPRPVGQAVSIIGALVIGQAAISSGLVSAPAVMVTVLTGIASFTIPAQSTTYVYVRFFWLVLASILGYFGLVLGIIVVLAHMASLRSFGVPYTSPLMPAHYRQWKDVFIRAPLWALDTRPASISSSNTDKSDHLAPPGPPQPHTKGADNHA